ncbi:MAG TPA: agmatine deiminase [Alphaproteobacteria bacterium]|nr:agmatine deiminase [Alphaproteobacteria bacterium]HAJ48232.1 agmatine deiminase [Alphaproteobacteria bacterium]
MERSRRLDAEDDCPLRDGLAMPAEWGMHDRTWMQWPCRLEPWGGEEGLIRARVGYGKVARAISGFEKVVMVVRPQDAAEAQLTLGRGIPLFEAEIDDSWARDSGPIFVTDGEGGVAGVHWRFNAWGNKYQGYAGDAALGGRVIDALAMRKYAGPMVLEGGSIAVDGRGLLMTTEQCLLNPNRNPALSQQQIEERLALFVGVTKVLWLGEGLEDDETDGHIDNLAAFAPGGKALVHSAPPSDFYNYRVSQDAIRRLSAARTAEGEPLEIIEVPQPQVIRRRADGRRLDASYINFYCANYGIVMPSFDDPMDEKARDILASAFPSHRVVQVPALDIVEGGGGIHCITQQQPAGQPLKPR